MKYIKLIFSFLIIISFVAITTYMYATIESENLTLSRIYVEPGTLEPEFSETRDYYTLLLDKNVTNLIVQATPMNKNLKYEIKGNENLKYGENLVTITVYSGDNQKSKVYTINALKTDSPDKYNALLSTLIVDNYPFNEDFFPEAFNYTLQNNVDNAEIEIFAYPQNPNAKVEIIGNNNLQDGKNIITVKVTSENGLSIRNYNIIASKGKVDLIPSTTNNTIITNETFNLKTILITTIIITIILFLIIFIIKKK